MTKGILVLLTIIASVSFTTSGQNITREVKKAEEAFSKGNYTKAIKSSTKVLNRKQSDPEALLIRGRSYYHLGIFDSAYLDLSKYITIPNVDDLHTNRFPLNATEFYSIWYSLGSYFFKNKNYKKSIDTWDKAAKLIPSSVLYSRLGVAKFFVRNYEEAIVDLNKAIDWDTTNYSAYYNRGQCFLRIDSISQAMNDYNKALTFETFKDSGHSYVGIGASFYKNGQFNIALEYLDKGLSYQYTCTSDGYLFRGLTKIELNVEGGCEDLLKAIECSGDNAQELFDKHCKGK